MSDKELQTQKARTQWAEDRTLLANERTFSNWMGTGLGSIGLAVAMQAVFGALDPTWLAKLTATIFILLSLFFFYAGCSNACKTRERLNSHSAEPASNNAYRGIATLCAFGSVITGITLWMI